MITNKENLKFPIDNILDELNKLGEMFIGRDHDASYYNNGTRESFILTCPSSSYRLSVMRRGDTYNVGNQNIDTSNRTNEETLRIISDLSLNLILFPEKFSRK
jgi:hypothetical protein